MVKKFTISLPDDVYRNLSELAERLSVSKSALVAELLGTAMERMLVLVQSVPEKTTPETYKRLRGQSKILIQKQIRDLEEYAGEVFDDD